MILRTERLVLRPFREDDVDAFAAFAVCDDYRRYLDADHPQPAQFVANNVGAEGAWVVELGDRVVGSVFLDEELACLLDPVVHRRGIAVEATKAVIHDGFDRRGHARIMAKAHPANSASLRAMAKLGFVDAGDGTYRLDRAAWTDRSVRG